MHIISGKYKHRNLITPKGLDTRPTTNRLRETLFNICQNYVQEARFLDLFAGSGAMGFEALSRGASSATFVDSHRESILAIKHNVQALDVRQQAHVIQGDVFSILQRLEKQGVQFDIIYADPPYSKGLSEQLLAFLDQHPLLLPNGYLFIEESSDVKLPYAELKTLHLVSERATGRAALLQFKKTI